MTVAERVPPPEVAEKWIRECLRAGEGRARLSVSGTCMEPTLMEGSSVELRSPASPVQLGEVVLLRTPAGLRLHRVLFRLGDTIRTKGDHGAYLDPTATTGSIIGICETGESRGLRLWNVARSVVRLLARSRTSLSGPGDPAHARLLP